MPADIQIYSIKSFLRKNESGYLNQDRIAEIINDIVRAAILHPNHNILIDFRETTISDVSMLDILKAAMELDKFKAILVNKIANVIPDSIDRIAIAKRTEAAIQIRGFAYKFFTDFEKAIDWLSDISSKTG